MNRTRQQELTRWLRQQRGYGGKLLHLASLLGLFSALLIIVQALLMAFLLQSLIIEKHPRSALIPAFVALLVCFCLRALIHSWREHIGFRAGQAIRLALRQQILNRLSDLGPAWIQGKPAGSWASLLLEQIEEMQEYYARYLPQMALAVLIPCCILLTIFPLNWTAGLILLATAPLIPLFMALVGMGAADANRRNFVALARLSGDFLDRLRGRETLRIFHRVEAEKREIADSTADFRQRTMEVLRLAFLSSAVLEFFASLSIAVVAVYFGFSYLGELHFGDYGRGVTLFTGFVALILAPEFFQPLRDLGTFYHAKAQAIGGADALQHFMQETPEPSQTGHQTLPSNSPLTIEASNVIICTAGGETLSAPLNFTLPAGQRVALVGTSGAGKSALMNVLLGFLPYRGNLRVNGVELRDLERQQWQSKIAWVGQNPQLPASTIGENIYFESTPDPVRLASILSAAGVTEFLSRMPQGLNTPSGEAGVALSVGQAQRIAVARALYKPAALLLLDEPAASLDARTEQHIMQALTDAAQLQTTLMITHQLDALENWDQVWVMKDGQLVQQGQWQTLIKQDGPLREMVNHRHKERT